jgi:hypothetical protein
MAQYEFTPLDSTHLAVTLSNSLLAGFFRVSARSSDVRACPDKDAGESTDGSHPSGTGCIGGEEVSRQCRPGLTGPFCLLCSANTTLNGSSDVYYHAAGGTTQAECRPCDFSLTGLTLGLIGVGLFGLVVALRLLPVCWASLGKSHPRIRAKIREGWTAAGRHVGGPTLLGRDSIDNTSYVVLP